MSKAYIGLDTGNIAFSGNTIYSTNFQKITIDNNAQWDLTYTTVKSNSGDWSYQGSDLKHLSASWQNTYTTVNSNSANWSGANTVRLSSTNTLPTGTVTYNCANGLRYFYYDYYSTLGSDWTANFINLGLTAGTATTIKIAVNMLSNVRLTIGLVEGTVPSYHTPPGALRGNNTQALIVLDILRALDGTYSVLGYVVNIA